MNGTPACLLDLRNQSVAVNNEMREVLQLENTELSFSRWILSFPQDAQKELHKVMNRLTTEGRKEMSIHVPKWNKQCKLSHLTNGQVAFTLKEMVPTGPVQRQPSIEPIDSLFPAIYMPPQNPRLPLFSNNNQPDEFKQTDLLDKFPDGLAILSQDWDVLYANSKMEEITGMSFEKNYLKKLWDLYPVDHYYYFFQHYLRAMETQETVEFEGYIEEVDRTVQVKVHPSDVGLIVFIQDVSHYKEQLQALKESEERFAILANNMKDVFWISDISFKQIHYLSPAFQSLFGMSRREALSDPLHVLEAVHPDDKKRVRSGMKLMKNQKHQVEYRLLRPNGDEQWMLTTGFPIENNGNAYVIGIHENITEKKEMDRLKEKSQQLSTITQMSAGIAHEIKNPLTAIKGFLQIGAANPELRDNYQDIILDEVNRIEAIVQDFMMLSKPKSSLQTEEVEPGDVVSYVTRLLAPEADEKNVQLIFNPKRINETIRTEPKRLNQILINLVKNAIDAVDTGGLVSIVAELTTHELTLSVSDNGPGLNAQELSKIGEPFFTTKEKGTGLGVMVTKKIVGDLNGTISYKSKKGEGTKVTVRLPR
ncbi:PAS domain S-box protein [Halobacillus locisalis]|uniref:histidine kinase n=1 Tax=Halobacillus locisalis TaxID=220753 RepID=A0A838CWE3_9BACI|nr:PAS domain S-box protein [Halobacillus locisalis]